MSAEPRPSSSPRRLLPGKSLLRAKRGHTERTVTGLLVDALLVFGAGLLRETIALEAPARLSAAVGAWLARGAFFNAQLFATWTTELALLASRVIYAEERCGAARTLIGRGLLARRSGRDGDAGLCRRRQLWGRELRRRAARRVLTLAIVADAVALAVLVSRTPRTSSRIGLAPPHRQASNAQRTRDRPPQSAHEWRHVLKVRRPSSGVNSHALAP